MAEIECVVATPEGPAFQGQVASVVVPALDGELGILPKHAPLVAALGSGELRVDDGAKKSRYFLDGGFVQVLNNRVTVLATDVEAVETIDRADAERRLAEARAERPAPGSSFEELDAHLARVRAAQKRLQLAS